MIRVLLVVLLCCMPLWADSEGPNDPSADGSVWTDPSFAYSQSDTYATAGADGDTELYTDFGFSIGSGSTVNGITIEYDGIKSGGANNTFRFNVLGAGTCTSKETGILATSDTDDYTDTQGGTSDTWSCTALTGTAVDNAAFGVSVEADRAGGSPPSAGTWELDHVRIIVEFTAAAAGQFELRRRILTSN